jgi:lipopolysaccharide/colanic/teichoic acid biosynthesis glycosyltransferase
MVMLDIYYIENWSLAMDLKILLRTIPAVLNCGGAF